MNFDLTITFAVILGISAIISPIIVTVINNNHQLKLKRYENQELAKRQAIIDFINATANCYSFDGSLDLKSSTDFQKSCNKLLLYFPDIDIEILNEIRSSLHSTNINAKDKEIKQLIIKLSKQLTEI